jgi:teichuronic acid biosynthesis glycosyltransferase TuaC
LNTLTRKIKVLIVIPGEEEGTSMIFAKRQAQSLDKSNVDLKIFFLSSRTSPAKLFSESKRFRLMARGFQPDVVHCHYGTMTSMFSAINSRAPLVITFHGSDLNSTPSDGMIKNIVGKFFSQISAVKAKRVICVSDVLVKKLWWTKKKAVVIPMGINTEAFAPQDKNEARKKLNWSDKGKIVLFNGNSPKIKRLDIAKLVIEKVKMQIPEAHLEVLTGRIEPDKMPLYINASDCLLLCSDSEGGPMIVKEALACNLPVVATDVGDVKERLNGVAGTFVKEQNVASLAEAVITVLNNYTKSEGRNKLIHDEISEAQVAEKIESVYRQVSESVTEK